VKRWVGSVLVLVACSSVSRERDESSRHVVRATLQFSDSAEEARFDAATECFAARPGWRQRPLKVGGNFIRTAWCNWDGSCSATHDRNKAGARWASVGTLHYPPKDAAATEPLPVFGVQVSVGEHNAQGWSTSVSASSNGKRILGDHAFLRFARHDDEDAGFSVGLSYQWTVVEQDFFHRVQEDPWVWLARVRQSPEALRDETLSAWTALHGDVVRALEEKTVRKCIYGEYEGDGIPPDCVERVPLSEAETAHERARVDARLASVKSAMADVDTLHQSLVRLAPPECF